MSDPTCMEISFIVSVAVCVKVAQFVRNVSGVIVSKMWYYDKVLVVEDLPIERLNREIKRRTKAIGAFSDGQSVYL